MRIAYLSVSPLIPSGYGKCTRELAGRLASEFDVTIFAYTGLKHSTIDVELPSLNGRKARVKVVGNTVDDLHHPLLWEMGRKFDLVLMHCDAWILREKLRGSGLRVVSWCVGDHVPVATAMKEMINCEECIAVVPMTEWYRSVLLSSPAVPKHKVLDPIPHGVDPAFWRRVDEWPEGIPRGFEFLVVSVVANYGFRENIPVMIEGFAQFLKRTKADAAFYIHAEPYAQRGYDLRAICMQVEEEYGVPLSRRVFFKSFPGYYPEEWMRALYSAADCQLMTVMAGSFEIGILESAMCGCPTIVMDFSGPGEVVGHGERGLVVPPRAPMWLNLISAKYYMPAPEDIAEALERYYRDEDLRFEHVARMREWIMENATWDLVAERWIKTLKEVAVKYVC